MAARKTKKTTAKSKTAKKKPAKKRSKSMEALYVASKVRGAIKDGGMNMAGDALEGLNQLIYWHIEQATQRAGENGRKTVRAHDFVI